MNISVREGGHSVPSLRTDRSLSMGGSRRWARAWISQGTLRRRPRAARHCRSRCRPGAAAPSRRLGGDSRGGRGLVGHELLHSLVEPHRRGRGQRAGRSQLSDHPGRVSAPYVGSIVQSAATTTTRLVNGRPPQAHGNHSAARSAARRCATNRRVISAIASARGKMSRVTNWSS